MNSNLHAWVVGQTGSQALLNNRYFSALREDRMSREDFVATQRQFYFAVRYFPRPMAALTARMPTSALRAGLIHNLSEEHGFREGTRHGFDPVLAHDLTFRRFLETLGIGAAEMNQLREGPAVRAFNTSLMGTCLMERTEAAFGCMGVIEHAFAGLSAVIGESVVRRGWVPSAELVHYTLHAEIDERHAAEFFGMVEEAWAAGGPARIAVEDGVLLGLHVFSRLYEDLLLERNPD